MKKCPFCDKPCSNDHCAYKEDKEPMIAENNEESKTIPLKQEEE